MGNPEYMEIDKAIGDRGELYIVIMKKRKVRRRGIRGRGIRRRGIG